MGEGFNQPDYNLLRNKPSFAPSRTPLSMPELFTQRINTMNQSSSEIAENGNDLFDLTKGYKGINNQSTKTFSTTDQNEATDGRFFGDKTDLRVDLSKLNNGLSAGAESRSSGIVTPLTGTGLRKTFLRNNNRMITIMEENEPSNPNGRRLFSSPEHQPGNGARSPHRSSLNIEQLRLGFSDGKGFLTKREEPEHTEPSNGFRLGPSSLFTSSHLARTGNAQHYGFTNSSRVSCLHDPRF